MIIPFDSEVRGKYYKLLDNVFDSNYWSEGKMVKEFEQRFGEYVGMNAKAVCNGGAGLLSVLDYVDVRNKDVIVPANTFWASAQAVKKAGGNVIYADCNRDDLCLSYDDMLRKITSNTKAVMLVHIGGHIAFDVQRIADYCQANNISLIEDCAHAHGATYNGRAAGSWGEAGVYSFYATKTMPLGEGGMVVSRNKDLLTWLGKYRNYGKEIIDGEVTYPMKNGFNFRLSEIAAALGIVQVERLPRIIEWKRDLANKFDKIFDNRVIMPEGMKSGYYKYIVFDCDLHEETGRVFGSGDIGTMIDYGKNDLPNTAWVVEHHRCVPIYYGWKKSENDVDELRRLIMK